MSVFEEKRTLIEWVSANEKKISDFHQFIWNLAEPVWREYKSAKAYCDLLRREGFDIEEGTGGGIGGFKWVKPLLPSDFKPPIDLRWPEYTTTVRVEEWWIPTPL